MVLILGFIPHIHVSAGVPLGEQLVTLIHYSGFRTHLFSSTPLLIRLSVGMPTKMETIMAPILLAQQSAKHMV